MAGKQPLRSACFPAIGNARAIQLADTKKTRSVQALRVFSWAACSISMAAGKALQA
ncbi:hypothetical protein [Polaromonas sp. CG9_12]|nr:hypothetical protein [Polaromonas sp. CG9_12]